MPAILARPFAGFGDILLLAQFARSAIALRKSPNATFLPGDFAWQLNGLGSSNDVRLWLESDRVVAFAIFEPPLHLAFDVLPGRNDAARLSLEILRWAEARRLEIATPGESIPFAYGMLGAGLAVGALDCDHERQSLLESEGYRRVERHNILMSRSLETPVPAPNLPPGASVRHITEADVSARVALHRDAWSVWGPSGFSETAYRSLRASPLYDETLDIVTVSPSGQLASSCIGWSDPETGIGHFEPVGTAPSFAGKGYGKGAILEGLRRMRSRGLRTARIGTARLNEPALALYRSCGFEIIDREHYWVRALEPTSPTA